MAEPVAPKDQGPNEQSIVASGMTVEEWEKAHPGQPMGPAPEEVDQVTTDPPDGSELTEEESLAAAEKVFPNQPPPIDAAAAEARSGTSVVDQPNPETSDVDTGEDDDLPPHGTLTTHGQLDAYLNDNGIAQPDGWNGMTVASKKAWLDQEYPS
jgi:hypothetical protein